MSRRRATAGISIGLLVLGVVVIARTIQAGVGGGLGLLLGGMLAAAGALRLHLATDPRRRPGQTRPARKGKPPSRCRAALQDPSPAPPAGPWPPPPTAGTAPRAPS